MSSYQTTPLLVFLTFFLFLTVPSHADFQAGKNAYDRGDYETALKEWQPLAEQGDAKAQLFIGYMYEVGQGSPSERGRGYTLVSPFRGAGQCRFASKIRC